MDELSAQSREIVEAGVAAGLYATPVPLQIFAYRSAQLAQVNMARTHLGADSLIGGRLLELIRIRSAQLRHPTSVPLPTRQIERKGRNQEPA